MPDSCCLNVTAGCGMNAMADAGRVYQKVRRGLDLLVRVSNPAAKLVGTNRLCFCCGTEPNSSSLLVPSAGSVEQIQQRGSRLTSDRISRRHSAVTRLADCWLTELLNDSDVQQAATSVMSESAHQLFSRTSEVGGRWFGYTGLQTGSGTRTGVEGWTRVVPVRRWLLISPPIFPLKMTNVGIH